MSDAGAPQRIAHRLRTARLVLDLPPPTRDSAAAVCAYYVRNRDHLAPWDPIRPASFWTEEHWAEALLTHRLQATAGQGYRWWLTRPEAPDHILGAIALNNVVRGVFQAAHLGYSVDADAQGQGLMGEAVDAVCRFAFHQLHLHRVMANYMPRNERSGRLLRRLGFQVEGYARDYLCIAGRWEDHVLTARVSSRRGAPPR